MLPQPSARARASCQSAERALDRIPLDVEALRISVRWQKAPDPISQGIELRR